MQADDYANVFKALSHPLRLMIMCGLTKKGRCNVNTMCERLGVSQSLVSQHINILKNANIIKGFREGNIIWYSCENELAKNLLQNVNIDICGNICKDI